MIYIRKTSFIILAISLLSLLSACGKTVLEDANDFISPIDEITIPENVQIIGLGEATHGNIEFQELKKDVFQVLLEQENVRVFILEGDFGGAQQINDYILNGNGTAKDVIETLDYGIYRTKQMIDLIEWMHNYNKTADEDEKIYFYGNDMQRYDYSKAGLLNYFSTVDPNTSKKFGAQLEHVTNDTMHDLTQEELEELNKTIDSILTDLHTNEADYIKQSSQESFSLAQQYARIMKQRTDLLMNEGSYARIRDQYLAENLEWIVEFESTQGRDKVFVSAHNGHIEKTSAAFGYESMGDYIDEKYGDRYFAIGTDFMTSSFQAFNSAAEERKNYTVKNNNKLVTAFKNVDPNIFYVDFVRANESSVLHDIISSEQKMPNIGDDFRPWYKSLTFFYTIKMIPNESYNGIIIVKEATPTVVINNH
ncbi:erythromycin esterase family protein [Pseudogracilibacillus sp. SE30717A]|uniref:erythromycin esterase family protein n=1 Tax=Pseudogracilibacillus sp. SE30717A TaxID=3098293 RepID=UPI00300E12AE